uniref:Manganese transport system membrane protein n=1 Tax=Sciadococcus taiwanensis TaxID=3028030 RepID=A0A9Y1I223_9RHOD|nr:manganese transport system membrane protein [Sciadococcus taiwanensis]
MIDKLVEPLYYTFMQRSLLIAILVGLLCSIVGSYLMVQRLALLGDAISHAVMPGLAIAFSLEVPIIIGALFAGVLSTILISWICNNFPIKEDTAIGIVFASFFAFGIILITSIQKNNKIDLNHFLFGNILGVTFEDVVITSLICAIVLFSIILIYKELLFYTFDYLGANVIGLPVKQLNFFLMVLVALTIIASMKAVGVVLVLALLVIPSACASLLVYKLHYIMTCASAIGIFSSITGMYISYFFNLPSGPAIVIVASLIFSFVLLYYKVMEYYKEKFKLINQTSL